MTDWHFVLLDLRQNSSKMFVFGFLGAKGPVWTEDPTERFIAGAVHIF